MLPEPFELTEGRHLPSIQKRCQGGHSHCQVSGVAVPSWKPAHCEPKLSDSCRPEVTAEVTMCISEGRKTSWVPPAFFFPTHAFQAHCHDPTSSLHYHLHSLLPEPSWVSPSFAPPFFHSALSNSKSLKSKLAIPKKSNLWASYPRLHASRQTYQPLHPFTFMASF